MNYTQPNNEFHEDTPKDWLFGALLFGRTIGFLLPENHGIIVDIKGDMKDLSEYKRVIVFNKNDQIGVLDAEDRTDLKEGDWVQLIDEDDIKN